MKIVSIETRMGDLTQHALVLMAYVPGWLGYPAPFLVDPCNPWK